MDRQEQILREQEEILDAVEDAGGTWTRQQERRWARLSREMTSIDRRRSLEPRSGRPDPTGDAPAAAGEQPEARALRPGESAVDYLESRGALPESDRWQGLSLGSYLRSVLLGPDSDVERRALAEGTDASGGFTVPDVLGAELIDNLRPQSHVLSAGARMVPLDSDSHSFARVDADPTPTWRAENASVAESDPTFDSIEFNPLSVAFIVRASRELMQDSVNLEEQLPALFSRVMANELDRVALLGESASSEPVGVRSATGISEEAAVGTISDYTPFLSIRRTILEANAPEPDTVIYSPRTGESVEGLTASDGQPLMRPPALSDWSFRETSKIPDNEGTASDESTAYVGNFSSLWIGQRLDVRIETLREKYADNLQVGFLVFARWDIQFEHPAALGRLLGITTA